MPRSIDLTAHSPYAVPEIRAAFGDEAYWAHRLGAFAGASPALTSLDSAADGTTAVSMTMRFGADQLPESMRRLRLPGLHIVQRELWYAVADDGVRGEITIDAVKTPISGGGKVHLSPDPAGTRLTGTAAVTVNVPLIGGTIATFVAGQLAQGIVDIVRITDSWLALNS